MFVDAGQEITDAIAEAQQPKSLTLSECGEIFCLLDAVDYFWAIQWKWRWKWDKHKRKRYAFRNTKVRGLGVTLYLHKEVLKRSGKRKPTKEHKIGDHRDGDSLNNQRGNLRWATLSMNNANRPFARGERGRFC